MLPPGQPGGEFVPGGVAGAVRQRGRCLGAGQIEAVGRGEVLADQPGQARVVEVLAVGVGLGQVLGCGGDVVVLGGPGHDQPDHVGHAAGSVQSK